MIHEPQTDLHHVAGHGDTRMGVFVECDNEFEVAWLLMWLKVTLDGINYLVPKPPK